MRQEYGHPNHVLSSRIPWFSALPPGSSAHFKTFSKIQFIYTLLCSKTFQGPQCRFHSLAQSICLSFLSFPHPCPAGNPDPQSSADKPQTF